MGKLTIRITRGAGGGSDGRATGDGVGPDRKGEPAYSDHVIDSDEVETVLDALELIRGSGEPGLRYRHSCHHGSCGTCGAIIDGTERLMCLTRLDELGEGPVTIEPLRKMTVIGDIAVDPGPLFSDLPGGTSYLRSSGVSHEPTAADSEGYERLEDCIECGLCVSVCPVTVRFVGPAALAFADRDREEHPPRLEASLAFAARSDGVAACERHFRCSHVCPQSVYPGRRIENLRRSLAQRGP